MLAIIGGTGLYDLDGLSNRRPCATETPFGQASDMLIQGDYGQHSILFLARHGSGHRQLPHEINYRANIYALKAAGATQIVSISAVGSLRAHLAPGALALPSQYFDWTRRRDSSFFGAGVAAHVSTAAPISANLSDWIGRHASALGLEHHAGLCYACVDGPRLGTQAESHFLRQIHCDIVGMTNLPEAFLAREAQICYATIGIITDYDCWQDDPSQHVTVDAIFPLYRRSLERVRTLLASMLAGPLPAEEPAIRQALRHAMLSDDAALDPAQRQWLAQLRR